MNSFLLPLHISFVGIWLGCVITEAIFERALLGKGRELELILVALHKRVDLFVEIPAFTGVLITGFFLYLAANMDSLTYIKIAVGILAIVTNIYCAWLVFKRAGAAHNGNWDAFEKLDHKQHQYGTVVLITIIIALAIGVYNF